MKCSQTYDLFFNPGEVTEIRAYGVNGKNSAWSGWARGNVYGYFDNAEDFGRCAEALDAAKPPAIYFTLNPVIPDLLARSANRLKAFQEKQSMTSDKEIQIIRWLPIDIDASYPHRLKISSTEEEVKETLKVRSKIIKWMSQQGFKSYIPACSGNGAHLAYRMADRPLKNRENPSEDPTVLMIRKILQVLGKSFNSDKVDIDQKVYNPSRIWRLYGTTSRKADNTPERPHRRSYIEPKFLKEKD